MYSFAEASLNRHQRQTEKLPKLQFIESLGSQVLQVVTGSDTDKVVTIYLAGANSLAIGIYLFSKR